MPSDRRSGAQSISARLDFLLLHDPDRIRLGRLSLVLVAAHPNTDTHTHTHTHTQTNIERQPQISVLGAGIRIYAIRDKILALDASCQSLLHERPFRLLRNTRWAQASIQSACLLTGPCVRLLIRKPDENSMQLNAIQFHCLCLSQAGISNPLARVE